MKEFICSFFLFLFTFNFTTAQNSLSGTVLDNKNKTVYFATVALYNASDSTIARTASTDEKGMFIIDKIKDGDYYLEVNMLGYATTSKSGLSFPTDNKKNIELTLEEDAQVLSEVEVVAKVPLLEQKSDRLVVNVENNITSLNSSLMDVMKKVPGMIVVNDRLSLAGSSDMTILINGKTTKYMDVQSLLRDMPGDKIKKVEIIHQPGAEFEASGSGPIINIILKKNSLYGTNGSVYIGGAKGRYWMGNTGVNLSHYQGNVNINGGIGYNRNAYFEDIEITRRVGDDIYTQDNSSPSRPATFRTNLALDWNITDRHRVGFTSRYLNNKTDNFGTNVTDINFAADSINDLRLVTDNDAERSWNLVAFNPYYSFEIDTSGQKIDFDVYFAQFNRDGMSILTTEETNFGENFPNQRNEQPGKTKIMTSKLDYQLPFSNHLKLQLGGQYSYANLDNDQKSFFEKDGDWVDNLDQSNHFIVTENIYAAYSKLNFSKDKWSGTLGLRYENSQTEGKSVTLDSTLTRSISQLFPSASLRRSITKELGATLAYSYRIGRPRYSSLNPFEYFYDPYTSDKGNPDLQPALTHSMKFNLTYENQPFFNIEYKNNSNAMVEVTEQNDETGTANKTIVNLETHNVFSTMLGFPLDFIPFISGYGAIIATHVDYDSKYLQEQFDRSKWNYTGYMQVNFKLPADINGEVTGWIDSGAQEGIMNAEYLYGVNAGFSKKFLNDKAKLSIGVNDLFNRFWHAKIDYANMDVDLIAKWDAPVVNMRFSYKFGNQHMKTKRHKSSGADVMNRASD